MTCQGVDDGYSWGEPEPKKAFVIGERDRSAALPEGLRAHVLKKAAERDAIERRDTFRFMLAMASASGVNVQRLFPKQKPLRKCALPGCENTTRHNGGYCSAEHCREHRGKR